MSAAEADVREELDAQADLESTEALALRVVDGLQAGATVPLEPGARIAVGGVSGSGGDDVTLRDPSVGDASVVVQRDERGVEMRALAGSIEHAGDLLEPGVSHRILRGDAFVLGGVSIQLVEMSLPAVVHQSAMHDASATAAVDPVSIAENEGSNSADEEKLQPTEAPSTLARVGRVGSLVVLFGAAGLAWLWHSGGLTPPPTALVSLEALLSAPVFAAVDIDESGDMPIVSGIVATRDDEARLDTLLQEEGVRYIDRVVSDEELAVRVATVFRVNDIPAELTSIEAGAVSVETRIADTSRLDELQERIRRDLPALTSLEIRNTPPPFVAKEKKRGPVDPGKRVVLVVSDEPAHVVTVDESRYFIGSFLPSGHRIASIDDGTVLLERNGSSTELEF